MFIPGSYHVYLAVNVFLGTPGYSFDDIPEFDWLEYYSLTSSPIFIDKIVIFKHVNLSKYISMQ